MQIAELFIHTIATCLIVACLIPPLSRVAMKYGFVDTPDNRKTHKKSTVVIGGLIIFPVIMAYNIWGEITDLSLYWPLYTALTLLLITGALDDRISLPAPLKFGVHVAAAICIVFFGGAQVAYLGDLFGLGPFGTDIMSLPFTLAAVVLLINAMNLIDGVDGLAGGVSLVIFFWMALAAITFEWVNHGIIILTMMGGVLGFLYFNMRTKWRSHAIIFLGDAGSMCLGLFIAWFAIHLSKGPDAPLEPIAVAWIIGFPIFDTCAQFYRRVCAGQSPFTPDRGHFHHNLMDAGIPDHLVTPIIGSIVFIMGAIGYGTIAVGIPQVFLTIPWIALLFWHILMTQKPERYVTLIKKIIS